MKQQLIEWAGYGVMALFGIVLHWVKQWQEAYHTATVVKPTFRSVIWSSPPDAVLSLLGSVALLAIGYVSGGLNAYAALLAGYGGDSATDKMAKK